MEMDMVMTFQSWSSYQLQIVFEHWNVTTKWQFAGSWFAIVFLTVAYHGLKFTIAKMEALENSGNYKRYYLGDSSGANVMGLDNNNASLVTGVGSKTDAQVTGISSLKYKLQHAAMTGVSYGFSLILMLVAMTYNPWLFVALMIGWTLGDFIFNPMIADLMRRTHTLSSTGGVVGSDMDCH